MGFNYVKKCDVVKLLHDVNPEAHDRVTLPELQEMMIPLYSNVDEKEEMDNAFRLFDEGGTGLITVSDLKRASQELGHSLSDVELQVCILS